MKKSLSLLTLMLLAGSSFAQNPAEAQKVIDLPLTYVNYDAPTTAYGSIAKGETIIVGYNKIVNGEVGFGLTSWKTNYIGYANIDYSNMVSKIKELKSAILTVECSGSTDSKRTAGIGVGYNEGVWSADMTYETADKTITVIGEQQWTSTKSAAVFETLTFDLTEVLAADADGILNLVIYNTQPAGDFLKNPVLTLDYVMAPNEKVNIIEDFESKELADYAADWTIGNKDRFTTALAQRTMAGDKTSRYFTVTAASTNGATHTYDKITNTADYQAAETVSLDFDFAMSAVANGSAQNQSVTIKDAEGNTLLVFNNHTINNAQEIPSPILNASGDTLGYFHLTARAAVANYFYHVNVATEATQTVITVKDAEKDTVAATLQLEGNIHVGGITYATGKTYGMLGLDEITYSTFTYDEIIEDPVFTPQGESYDTVYVAISTETADAVIKYTIDGGAEQTYTEPVEITTTSTLAAWAEKNGSVSNTVSKKFVACVTPAPELTKEGQTYGANTITIKSGIVGGETYYTVDGGEEQLYTEPIVTDKTLSVTAWNVYEGRPSETVSLTVTAGVVETPTATLVKVIDAERYIALSTATAAANLVYMLNGEAEVVGELGKDTIVLTADTKIKVWARYTEGEKVFESEAIDTTFAAGTLIQLAGVEISTEDYSAISKSADLKVATSQLEVLLNPAVEIVWAYGETSGVAANGDIIKGVPVGAKFTAYTRAAGYIDSEVSTVEVVPSYASTIFSEDYEDGTTGSWTAHGSWPMTNTEAADGTHFLHFYQEGQGGNRWAQLEFPEYSSTAYTLSFKIGIAAGNDAPSTFTVYAGQDTLFQFNTPTDNDRTAGERITTVLNKNGETIGTFGFYLKERFVWADDKLANVEVTVSESGVVLTVVNNLGQTQVKTKIADAPVVITKLYEDFGRRYGSFRMDDVKIAGRAGSVMAPEFALHHYDGCDPAIAITDATDKTKIYYRAASTTYTIDEDGNIVPGEYTFTGEFLEYDNPVAFTYEATIIEAYAVYEGVVESAKSLSPVYLHLSSIEAPTVTFAAVVDTLTRSFSVKDNTSELVSATLYYQPIGATEANVLEESTIQSDSAAYGWFSVYAQVSDLKSATTYRYVDSRTVYNEPYVGFCGAGNSFPAEIADFEATVGATIVGDYPTSPVPTTGTQRIHVATKGENYAAVVLPFTFTTGTNVVTNAKGDTLEYGVDYQFVTIHTRTAQNADNNADLTLLTTFRNVESAVRAKGVAFQAGKSVLVKALTENVGNEIVLHSLPTAPIAVGTAITKVPTNGGWRIVSNNRYQDLALETPAYVLNDEGTKFVYTENPIVGSLSVAILVDPASVDALGKQILLVDDGSSVIETIAAEGQNTGNIYDLQGRKVQQVVNGQMYIVNGKRLILK